MKSDFMALRMDDIFASTKKFEVYGKDTFNFLGRSWPLSMVSNFLFMKYMPGFRRRLAYEEMTVNQWERVFSILKDNNAALTVGVTASWVEANGVCVPFFEKFPKQADVLRQAACDGLIEIANHGYTHCVVGKHTIHLFKSNRLYHREFWPWVLKEIHEDHIKTSQKLLTDYFGFNIETFVPPGNVWTSNTEKLAYSQGLKYLSSREQVAPTGKESNGLVYISDGSLIAFHDRELVLDGVCWLEALLKKNKDKKIVMIKELAKTIKNVSKS